MELKFWSSIFLCLGLVGIWPDAHAAPDQIDSKLTNEVKAAYLLNFIRYTEWPLNKFQSADDPVLLCILGKDPFGDILEQTFKDKETAGRNLRVKRFPQADPAVNECHAAYISKIGKSKAEELEAIKSVENMHVLTVTEANGVSEDGVIIHFFKSEETIQFEINLKVAERSGLKLSSRMIPFAKKVYN